MIDYATQGEQRLWELFNASSFFQSKFKAKNQLSFIGGKPFPEKANRAPADYPEAKLRSSGGVFQGFTGNNSQKTFGNTAPGSNTAYDFTAEDTVNYEWTLTYDGMDEVTPNKCVTEMANILYNAGINLGLSKAKVWGPITYRTEQRKDATRNGTLGTVQTIIIPVTFKLHRADIIGTSA